MNDSKSKFTLLLAEWSIFLQTEPAFTAGLVDTKAMANRFRKASDEHDELIADRKRLEWILEPSNELSSYMGRGKLWLAYDKATGLPRGTHKSAREAIDIAMDKDNVEATGNAGSVTTAESQSDRGQNPGTTSAPVADEKTKARFINFGDDFNHGNCDVLINFKLVRPDENGNYNFMGESRYVKIEINVRGKLS